MKVICEQAGFLLVHGRFLERVRTAELDGDLLFLGIAGPLGRVYGSDILPFKETAEKCKGIVLFLSDVRFKNDTAREFTPNIKFFIDGVEKTLNRNVLIVGCPIDQRKTGERYILNEDRWPTPKAENSDPTIPANESEGGS